MVPLPSGTCDHTPVRFKQARLIRRMIWARSEAFQDSKLAGRFARMAAFRLPV